MLKIMSIKKNSEIVSENRDSFRNNFRIIVEKLQTSTKTFFLEPFGDKF